MQLFQTLSHMPFIHMDTLVYCISDGLTNFEVKPTDFAAALGMKPQVTTYYPWEMAVYHNGVTTKIRHHFPMNTLWRIFCNPVMDDLGISFCYGRALYRSQLNNELELVMPHRVAGPLFTGYVHNGRMVIAEPPCKPGAIAQLDIGGTKYNTCFDVILRVVPHGPDVIVTGQKANELFSVLWLSDGGAVWRIRAYERDVYKCCLDDDTENVIHTMREDGRYLHTNPVELFDLGDTFTEVTS